MKKFALFALASLAVGVVVYSAKNKKTISLDGVKPPPYDPFRPGPQNTE